MSFEKFITTLLPHLGGLRKSQRKTLAVLVWGLMPSRRGGVSAITHYS
jgi:hypothetical protein